MCLVDVAHINPYTLEDFRYEAQSRASASEAILSSIEKHIENQGTSIDEVPSRAWSSSGNGEVAIQWRCNFASIYAMSIYVDSSPIKTECVELEILPASSDPHRSWLEGFLTLDIYFF